MAKKQSINDGTFTPVEIKKIDLVIMGMKGSPLVIHAMAQKSIMEMREKQGKKAKKKKEARDPEAEFLAARYVDEEGRECLPLMSFKKSIISAATAFDDITKVGLRQAFFVEPSGGYGVFAPMRSSFWPWWIKPVGVSVFVRDGPKERRRLAGGGLLGS